jgi:hypothetical protein
MPTDQDRPMTDPATAQPTPGAGDGVLTPREQQHRNFAFGNASIDNPDITREIIDDEANKMQPTPGAGGAADVDEVEHLERLAKRDKSRGCGVLPIEIDAVLALVGA